jgi:prepilin-type N-terminal cleavage/methylation domain-containing protein/prepilin-type processing-associated H-X9-DG protein
MPPSIRKAFTLLEVLVVIAIIAVLIAFLIPSVRTARGMAQQVPCASRMRSLAQAFIAYASDNDGQMCTTSVNGVDSSNWVFWQAGRDINRSALAKYLSAKDEDLRNLFRCPSALVEEQMGFQNGRPYPLTITMNARLHPVSRYGMVLNPGHKILLYDENENADDDIFWFETQRDTLAGRHGSRSLQVADINDAGTRTVFRQMGNVAFFDAHVEPADNQLCHQASWNDPSVP